MLAIRLVRLIENHSEQFSRELATLAVIKPMAALHAVPRKELF